MQKIVIDTNVIVSSLIQRSTKIDLISDKDDNKVLELADECEANFIITGNITDFTFAEYKNTKIVSPKDYWELYAPKKNAICSQLSATDNASYASVLRQQSR